MKPYVLLIMLIAVLLLTQACNTLYNTKTINIEVLEPASAKLPDEYKAVAVRYNNANVAWNPWFAQYYHDDKLHIDSTNLDSLASFEYFRKFNETIGDQSYFNSITELEAADYSTTKIEDTAKIEDWVSILSTNVNSDNYSGKIALLELVNIIKNNPPHPSPITKEIKLDKDYGLYTDEEIKDIHDSTQADLLLSLDYFYTQNVRTSADLLGSTQEIVLITYFWSGYDLKKVRPVFSIIKTDTIRWDKYEGPYQVIGTPKLPQRKDAVMSAAYIAGEKSANYLIPHWINVDRMYYRSGHVDLKAIPELVKNNNWLEAAKLWKKQTNSENKNIAAKCMFNMALAYEMSDQLDAALEWAVKSYHVFGNKNETHAFNCVEYIRILGQRKRDRKIFELQASAPRTIENPILLQPDESRQIQKE